MLQGKQTGRGKWILGALASVIIASSAQADIRSSVDADAVSKRVSTKLGLYVTSADANAAIEASPEIVFIDVRNAGGGSVRRSSRVLGCEYSVQVPGSGTPS